MSQFRTSDRYLISFLWVVCATQIIAALGFFFQWPVFVQFWPLPYSDSMTFMFAGSIFVAAAASTGWCLYSANYSALAGVAVDYIAMFTPVAVFTFQIGGNDKLRAFSLISVIAVLFGIFLFSWSHPQPVRDPIPMPRWARWSFIFFVLALIIAGGAMVLKVPNILPWEVLPIGQVIYGWMFLGAAAYFAYGVFRASWQHTAGQLAGFLAYDLVLIIPLIGLWPTVGNTRLLNLVIYLLVVSYSGVLASYYLFINPKTRLVRARLA